MTVNKVLGGRPPLKIPDEELDDLGQDLLRWLDNEGKNSVFFQDWFYDVKGFSRADWKLLLQRQGFRPYYDIARIKMSRNMMMGELDKSFSHRYLGMYDDQLLDHEESVRDRDAKRKLADNAQDTLNSFAKLQALMGHLYSASQTSENKAPAEDHNNSPREDG